MSTFKDTEEVYTYIGKAFELAVVDEKFVEATKGGNLVVLITQTEPAATILVDFPGQKVLCGDAAVGATSSVQLKMSSDNANKFWQGKLNFTLAMAQRKVKMEGKRSTALALLPLTGSIFEKYKALLVETGREDLIVD